MRPLNPGLFNLLQRRFKDIEFANRGMKPRVSYVSKMGQRRCVVKGGEYYRVNCPKCGDRRNRLWIHHMYGTFDRETGSSLNHLAYCYNCGADFTNFYDEELSPLASKFHLTPRIDYSDIPDNPEPAEVGLPHGVIPVDELGEDHIAVNYLRSRNFDHKTLGQYWYLSYCPLQCGNWQTRGRLIIPMLVNGKMMGWQARALRGETPKYQTARGMQRNSTIYNYDLARDFEVGIICEGPFDALRVGPPGMSLLGKSLSEPQVRLLGNGFRGKYLIIMTDADKDGVTAADKIYARLTEKSPFAGVSKLALPSGKDPADQDYDDLWKLINAHITSEFGIPAIDPVVRTDLKAVKCC